MAESRSDKLSSFGLRAAIPRYVRYGAIALLGLTVIGIGISYINSRTSTDFRMKGRPTSLSKDVVATVDGYERTEYDEGTKRYYIKADRAVTYSDNHQELENVFLQVFAQTADVSDRITADKAIYIPEEDKNFTAYLAGKVNVDTRDGLKVMTDQITYRKSDETATAEESVEFVRENVSGSSYGAVVNVPKKLIELLREVEIRQYESVELSGEPSATINAGYASYDQLNEKVETRGGTKIHSVSKVPSRMIDLTADHSVVSLFVPEGQPRQLKSAEVFQNVSIQSVENSGPQSTITSGYALYDKPSDSFNLRDDVNIVTTSSDSMPTTITSSSASYGQSTGHIELVGSAQITQGANFARGDKIIADLFPTKRLKTTHIVGSGYLRQIEADRTIEISATELNAAFADGQALTEAHAVTEASTVLTPSKPEEYSKVTMETPRSISLRFKQGGILEKMFTEGRTTIQLDSPNNAPDAANKRVTADTVRTFFSSDGKNLLKAEAVGSAELFVDPLKVAAENYKTKITAPRFDCEFFPTGNNAKNCSGGKGTRTVRTPTLATVSRGEQVLTAESLNAAFSETSRDIEKLDALGNARFSELDRNGLADQMSFMPTTGIVQLRGGEPAVWDSRARAKAREIDWDTKNERSSLRRSVSTTYYSQKQAGGATPFSDSNKPVFVTSDTAEIDHRAQTATYSGNARGWQEKSYVRARRFYIQQPLGQFDAEGNVQSLLFDVKRKENGIEKTVPVSALSDSMTYYRDTRLIRYVGGVDVRQATDRITGGRADIYLNENNELSRSEFRESVIITQPKRRADADSALYNASDESVILRGNPARVEDAENGTSQAGQMTIFLRSNRVVSEGRSTQNANGRTRSIYKIKEN